jgi:N-acetyl-1-D-myo-inositol-2-amino-2-deoxy-alpha-D-glucopyranoside deacetylase
MTENGQAVGGGAGGPTIDRPARRMVLVHAHPDDESIGNGATMARYAAEGVGITLVTCTRGEEGEVLVPELSYLASSETDKLGEHRVGELAAAMAALGVTDHRFLGGAGRYRDTGMIYTETGAAGAPPDVRPDTFWAADLLEATNHLVPILREVRPHVLITYEEMGGYGHPDHVQAHRVAMYAHTLAGVPSYRPDLGEPWRVPKVYWNAMPKTAMLEGARRAAEAGIEFFTADSVDHIPFIVEDDLVTTEIDARDHLDAKLDAMRAHATQITVDGPFFALSNLIGREAFGVEFYRLAVGELGPRTTESGREADLFAGLDGLE